MERSIRAKFRLLLVPLVGMGTIVAWIAGTAMRDSTVRLSRASELSSQALMMRVNVTEMADAMKGYLLDPRNEAEAQRKLVADESAAKAVQAMKELAPDPQMLKLIDAVGDFDEAQLNPSENAVLGLVKEGRLPDAQARYVGEYLPLRRHYNELSDALQARAREIARLEVEAVGADMRAAVARTIAALVTGVLLVAGAILIMTERLSRRLGGITGRIAAAGGDVAVASERLGIASREVSDGTTRAAAALEQSVAAVEELSSMVRQNTNHAKDAASRSLTTRSTAETGEGEVRKLNDAVLEIAQSSRRIEEIINVIEDIAFQTNLLALNAAVEAARAGEQGRGFAVVAEAVRTLAQRSAAAAKDITTLIKDSVERIGRAATVADGNGVVLRSIVESVRTTAELNAEIASASQEQANGLAQISQAMNELDGATQRNAGSAQESATAASGMADQAVALHQAVSELRRLVEGGAAAASVAAAAAEAAPRRAPVRKARLVSSNARRRLSA
jgi:methyl-accepting chemotaxis protein